MVPSRNLLNELIAPEKFAFVTSFPKAELKAKLKADKSTSNIPSIWLSSFVIAIFPQCLFK